MAGKRYNDLTHMQTHGFGGYKGKARKTAKQHSANMKALNKAREEKRAAAKLASPAVTVRQRDPNAPVYLFW